MEVTDFYRKARELLVEHDLNNYELGLHRGRRLLGKCWIDLHRITLSKYFVEACQWADVKLTVLHEIAHAIDARRRGRTAHDRVFRQIAKSIGASTSRSRTLDKVPRKYIGYCSFCLTEFGSYVNHKKGRYCAKCCDKYNGGKVSEEYRILWRENPEFGR